VFLLSARTARFLNAGHIPGVTVSDALLATCEKQARSPDAGSAFFLELAAKQAAVLRGLGYRGAYYSGVHRFADLERLLQLEASFAPDDWRGFAREIRFRRPGEFYLLAEDAATGLADPERLEQDAERPPSDRRHSRHVTLGYRLSRWSHDLLFTPGRGLAPLAESLYRRARDPLQGPKLIRTLERGSKAVLYDCRDCGDCSLPEIAFLCPESQCVKNQRNGPCGGTRDGLCEVGELPCIWARAYDRDASRGDALRLLDHAPVLQDQALRGTSAWANTFLGRDHLGRRREARAARDREAKNGEDRLKPAS
jgi:methylenetetrahydrofolate reductase (NADPH)